MAVVPISVRAREIEENGSSPGVIATTSAPFALSRGTSPASTSGVLAGAGRADDRGDLALTRNAMQVCDELVPSEEVWTVCFAERSQPLVGVDDDIWQRSRCRRGRVRADHHLVNPPGRGGGAAHCGLPGRDELGDGAEPVIGMHRGGTSQDLIEA